jgi:hypothetical protein
MEMLFNLNFLSSKPASSNPLHSVLGQYALLVLLLAVFGIGFSIFCRVYIDEGQGLDKDWA